MIKENTVKIDFKERMAAVESDFNVNNVTICWKGFICLLLYILDKIRKCVSTNVYKKSNKKCTWILST